MQRPPLSTQLSEAEFRAWYWLKAELVDFCKTAGLPTSGSKLELAESISAHLAGREPPTHRSRNTPTHKMPNAFSTETVIGPGWRCSQALRAFFESQIGKHFSFNGPLREFITSGTGHTLGDAIAHYRQSLTSGPRPISKQFEYNHHMREFRTRYPSSTHAEAVSAWWAKRGKPGP